MKLFWILFLIGGLSILTAQTLKVQSITPLTSAEQGEFYFPQMHPSGTKVICTGPGYRGLYAIGLEDQSLEEISDDPGAGYEFVISADGQHVFFRTSTYRGPKRYSSLLQLNMTTKEKTILEAEVRDLSTPQQVADGSMVYVSQNQVKRMRTAEMTWNTESPSAAPAVFIENRKIALYRGNEKTLLEPFGEGIYIWPSVSPDGDRLLFTLAGQGTFISDLDGNVLSELGRANAPQWSPDGQWVVFMDDRDDGRIFTASEIFVIRADGSEKIQLTNTDDIIEMYPRWGTDNRTIVYASDSGTIYLMKLTR